jgi:hypothetical protein
MKRFSVLVFLFVVFHGPVLAADEGMSDAQKMRFCERVRDHALQTYYNRERGQPMKLFTEDGSDGSRITNVIIKRIYADRQISSPEKAETFGRTKCNEMMGTKQLPE